jgi:carbon-monoxide dehydrogenase medium subunit
MIPSFEVFSPLTVSDAARELARLGERVKIYAGGTELLLLLRNGLIDARYLMNIKNITALSGISWDGRALTIGAAVTHHRLEIDPLVTRHLPMFVGAESRVANIRVRNQGTLGGNLCFNDPHSDPATALLIYETCLTIAGPSGQRHIPLNDFLTGMYATAMEPNELLVNIVVPPLPSGWGDAYLRIHRFQRPTLGVAAAVAIRDEQIESVRLAVGCVGPRSVRLTRLEAELHGLTLAESELLVRAPKTKKILSEVLRPADDLLGSSEYKLYITAILVGRALREAVYCARTRAEGSSKYGKPSDL